ncbi:MAG: YegP family protein [Saprospiraceae bacterium]|nr:YegP family protein [Saprospiraceae bacterium]
MNNPKFTKFISSANKFRFNLKAENGEIVLHSEDYETEYACNNGIDSVRINSPYDANYDRLISNNNQYYFVLKANNGKVIGVSETHTTKQGNEVGIASVKRVASTAPVENLIKSTMKI